MKVELKNEDINDEPVRETKALSDIYERCNVAIMEPVGYEEAVADKRWVAALKEEFEMIEKNQTWMLVDRTTNKKKH